MGVEWWPWVIHRCQSSAPGTGMAHVGQECVPDAPLPVSSQLHWCLGSHILHTQLGSIEQQQFRCFVVPIAHGLVECCVPFLILCVDVGATLDKVL